MLSIPEATWSRRLDAAEPSAATHTFSRPPVLEALTLLPIAYRVGTYIGQERSKGSEPIFDLSGMCLEPPKPGPHAGVPLGGLGGGCIGRGFKGEFRRWSLAPGRYVHRTVKDDVFCRRVKRGTDVKAVVLSVGERPPQSSPLGSWNWSLPQSCGTYHALYPRAWTVYENPVPGITVVIEQLSPFLPGSYSEASMPCATFNIDVSNTDPTCPVDVSIMFCFQNGYGGGIDCTACNGGSICTCCSETFIDEANRQPSESSGGLLHSSFSIPVTNTSTVMTEVESITGVCMTRPSVSALQLMQEPGHCRYCGQASSTTPSAVHDVTKAPTSVETLHASMTSTDALPSDQTNHYQSKDCEYCCQTGLSSFSIAAHSAKDEHSTETKVSTCTQFVTDVVALDSNNSFFRYFCGLQGASESAIQLDPTLSSRRLWEQFYEVGDITDCETGSDAASQPGTRVGAAVCLRKHLPAGSEFNLSQQRFSFSLAWDDPYVRFGAKGKGVNRTESDGVNDICEVSLFPRYYTRFFGTSGLASAQMAAYALLHSCDWRIRICEWQEACIKVAKDSSQPSKANNFYDSQLFNELYFLVDGGTVWTDSSAGVSNQKQAYGLSRKVGSTGGSPDDRSPRSAFNKQLGGSQDSLLEPLADRTINLKFSVCLSSEQLEKVLSKISETSIAQIHDSMINHDSVARCCAGDQRLIGQFLYLEGHEYLMYNTYDVHFYASFSLLMLWPQLELSLQRDFAIAVSAEDPTYRVMMGTGEYRPRKVKGVVPHDLGSPSEKPWTLTNAYNFQDVSRWKDLGPKFILQIYRDYMYLCNRSNLETEERKGLESFLQECYPMLCAVMETTTAFDTDKDGMIENAGFPDQTYDIWTATGVHAYCGGLWIAACEAMAKIAAKLSDTDRTSHFADLAGRARTVYFEKLWNGRYLNYDSSTSDHHDSIMADMMAGQWYARACNLPAVVSQRMALSCFREIYKHNVVAFGGGRLIGAVNGMRPPADYDTKIKPVNDDPVITMHASASVAKAIVDNSCMQSREVWTGTTYALAAAMLQEATASSINELSPSERDELRSMAHCTAQGIHDGGWQEFGYWFATPEGWEENGNYRSLGYMRALAIWAIQYAKEVQF